MAARQGAAPTGAYPVEDSSQVVTARPAAHLRGQVLGYRGWRLWLSEPQRRLEVPTAAVTIVIGFGPPLYLAKLAGTRWSGSFTSLVCGMQTTATVGEGFEHAYGIEATLTPLAALTVLGVPMNELADRIVPLDDLLGPAAAILAKRLAEAPDWAARFRMLDAVLTERFQVGPRGCAEVAWAWQIMRRAGGRMPVERLARQTGWSRRHLERLYRAQVGLSPKSHAQVLRLQGALRLAAGGMAWSEVAATAGFYDQAHLDHACQAMLGCTPTTFRAGRAIPLPAGSIDRIPGQVTSVVLPG